MYIINNLYTYIFIYLSIHYSVTVLIELNLIWKHIFFYIMFYFIKKQCYNVEYAMIQNWYRMQYEIYYLKLSTDHNGFTTMSFLYLKIL